MELNFSIPLIRHNRHSCALTSQIVHRYAATLVRRVLSASILRGSPLMLVLRQPPIALGSATREACLSRPAETSGAANATRDGGPQK